MEKYWWAATLLIRGNFLVIERRGDRCTPWWTLMVPLAFVVGCPFISSEQLVISLGEQGYLASFGAGGIPPAELEEVIQRIQQKLKLKG